MFHASRFLFKAFNQSIFAFVFHCFTTVYANKYWRAYLVYIQ